MKKVVVYTADTCPSCKKAKEYLIEQEVEFEERNTSEMKNRVELMKKGYMSIPVVIIDNVEIVGFNREKIDSALKGD